MDHFQLLPIAWNLLHSVSTPVMLKVSFKYLFLLESPGQPGLAQTDCKHAGTACPQHPLINCSSLQPFCTGQHMNCSREKDFPNIYGNLATQRPCPVTFCPPGPHSLLPLVIWWPLHPVLHCGTLLEFPGSTLSFPPCGKSRDSSQAESCLRLAWGSGVIMGSRKTSYLQMSSSVCLKLFPAGRKWRERQQQKEERGIQRGWGASPTLCSSSIGTGCLGSAGAQHCPA